RRARRRPPRWHGSVRGRARHIVRVDQPASAHGPDAGRRTRDRRAWFRQRHRGDHAFRAPAPLARAPPAPHLEHPRPRELEHRSVLEDGALLDRVAAAETVALRAKRVRDVVPRNDDVVELPYGAVLLHARHGVVDVELAGDTFWILDARELPLRRQLHRVDDLILLRDLHLLRVDIDLALLGREHDAPIEPYAFDLVGVRVVVLKILDTTLPVRHLLRPRAAARDRPDALGLFG